ncbi:MAG: histidine--tRNA ligase [Clostridia bacterium]|nr:histidine--tRNA ligase [Clostridia bacterium]
MGEIKRVKPRTLSGFMELLPKEQIEFNRMKGIIEHHYERAGFIPLDTPIIEASEILLAKAGGETEKQIYRFLKGDTDLSMRFDHTVPLAKYVALHQGELTFPYKRYAIGKVYRGERPQKGRFREFYQADIDIIGDGKLDIINDAEMPSIIYGIFKELDFGPFTIRINNRKVLSGFFEELGLQDKITDILRVIDKIDKIGVDAVKEELVNFEVSNSDVEKIINFISIKGSQEEVIKGLENLGIQNELFNVGVKELGEVSKYIEAFGVPKDYYEIDLTIARGLDYYTGTVYETILNDYKSLGSVCSGGRYDNLAEYYTNKQLPGVGISIGLTRLFYQLNEAGVIKGKESTPLKALVVPMDVELDMPIKTVATLRENGISSSIVFDKKGMKPNLNYANKEGIPYVIIIGETELNEGKVMLKDMTNSTQELLTIEEVVNKLK